MSELTIEKIKEWRDKTGRFHRYLMEEIYTEEELVDHLLAECERKEK